METCPRCGATLATGQEYCLECGLRLERPQPGPGPRDWVWPVLVGLLVAAMMTGVAIAVARGGDPSDRPTLVATTETGIAVGPTAPTQIPPEPTTATTATTTATAETTTATEPPPRRVIEWPAGRTGYTVVLASIPRSAGRAAAIAKGNEALRTGLEDVGVLESSRFRTLNPGYYVVFAGIYSSEAEARRGRARAAAAGYGIAYVRQIRP